MLALLARDPRLSGPKVLISKDKDLLPFVAEDASYYNITDKEFITPQNFSPYAQRAAKLKSAVLTQDNWTIYRAITGERGRNTDNIPGVLGMGPGYTEHLLKAAADKKITFGGVHADPAKVLEQLKAVAPTPVIKEALQQHGQDMVLSYQVVNPENAPQAMKDALQKFPLEFPPAPTDTQISATLNSHGFHHFLDQMPAWSAGFQSNSPTPVSPAKTSQIDLQL